MKAAGLSSDRDIGTQDRVFLSASSDRQPRGASAKSTRATALGKVKFAPWMRGFRNGIKTDGCRHEETPIARDIAAKAESTSSRNAQD